MSNTNKFFGNNKTILGKDNPVIGVRNNIDMNRWPELKYFGDEFLFTFASALDMIIRRANTGPVFITNMEMLKKRNVVTFATNGHLEIFKLKPDYTGFDFSRTYQVNTVDCSRNWTIFYDFDELIEFINKHQRQALIAKGVVD